MRDLAALLSRFSTRRVLVVGDLILDEDVSGESARLSPEAPVPVVTVSSSREVLGGAANTAANVAALGGRAVLVGGVGQDDAGARLVALAERMGIEAVTVVDARPTVRKVRVLGQQRQLLRMDYESDGSRTTPTDDDLLGVVRERMGACDIVVLSDYAKGFLTRTLCQSGDCGGPCRRPCRDRRFAAAARGFLHWLRRPHAKLARVARAARHPRRGRHAGALRHDWPTARREVRLRGAPHPRRARHAGLRTRRRTRLRRARAGPRGIRRERGWRHRRGGVRTGARQAAPPPTPWPSPTAPPASSSGSWAPPRSRPASCCPRWRRGSSRVRPRRHPAPGPRASASSR